MEEADFLLTTTSGTVLLSDVLFLDGEWRDSIRIAQGLHPMVVFLVWADPVDLP